MRQEGQGRPGPGPYEGGPDLKGQGRWNWVRAGPDRPVDSLQSQLISFLIENLQILLLLLNNLSYPKTNPYIHYTFHFTTFHFFRASIIMPQNHVVNKVPCQRSSAIM